MTDVPKTARAAVLVGINQPFEIREVPIPDTLEHGALLVKMSLSSICGSDIADWTKDIPRNRTRGFPRILGHEMVGRIVRFGDGPRVDSVGTPLQEGDRIVWAHPLCGRCLNCTVEQEPTLCLNRKTYSVSWLVGERPYLTGTWAEYGYVFPGSGRVKVPDEVPDEIASASSCAFRTVVSGMDRLGKLDDRHTMVIQGSGPLGLFATAVAARSGPHQLVVIGGPAHRLDVAKRWGATHAIDIDEVPNPDDRHAMVMELTRGLGADRIIEVSGASGAFSQGFKMLRRGGTYSLVGQGSEPVPIVPAELTAKHAQIVGNSSGSIRHYYRALQFVKNNPRISWMDMISNRYLLEQINDAMQAMRDWREVKPVLTFAS
jgi:threonine dehydrogenase-like Zn-dependent dehydrogenase